MSTTVVISPAVGALAGSGGALLPLALVIGTALWAATRAVGAQDPTCLALLSQSRKELQRERLATIEIRSTDLDRLRRSAGDSHLKAQPISRDGLRFSSSAGSVWAARTPDGIRMVGHEDALRQLLVANTTSRVIEHLRGRGLEVDARRSGGELTIVGKAGGSPTVEVGVGRAGEARVDLKNFAGKECEEEVRSLAAAVDGTITSFCPKPEYFGSAPILLGSTTRA